MPPKRLPSFRAVEDRVLFNFGVIQDKVRNQIEERLLDLGLAWDSRDPRAILVDSARGRFGDVTHYYRTAKTFDAPSLVNCSTFIQWCYGQIGVEVPYRTLQQFRRGDPHDDLYSLKVGDLIFKTGAHNYWEYSDPKLLVGHVGMVSDVDSPKGGIVHAISRLDGVVEVPIDDFLKNNGKYVATRRIVPDLSKWSVLMVPESLAWRIRESEDVEMLLYEKLPVTARP